MSHTIRIRLHNAQQARQALSDAYQAIKPLMLTDGKRYDLIIKPETRSTAQNARMWTMLTDISAQVIWHGQRLVAEDWKAMATAALKRQRVVPGLEGGFVVLGESTRVMTKAELGELMDFLEAFGAQHSVKFSAPEHQYANHEAEAV